MDLVTELLACLGALVSSDLRNLISYRIKNHSRMIVIFSYHRCHIFFPPLLEIQTIIIVGFQTVPHIKSLIHNIHTNLITRTQHSRSHRMMRHTDCIESSFFHFQNLTVLCIFISCSTKKSTVVMNTAAT